MTFYSQDKQDYFLENSVFKGYKNGVFVDVGPQQCCRPVPNSLACYCSIKLLTKFNNNL